MITLEKSDTAFEFPGFKAPTWNTTCTPNGFFITVTPGGGGLPHPHRTTPLSCSQSGLISNTQREDISPVEVAETLQRLLEDGEGIRSQRDLARLLGMRDAWVSDILRILTLPAKLQELLRTAERAVPYDTVMRVAHSEDPAFQAELIERKPRRRIFSRTSSV
jgi:hypothetical protein